MRLWGRDLHTLSGAYALDALEGGERERFERHLAHCRRCADEVRGLTATATGLALAAAEAPPADLRTRVLAAATVTRQLPPVSSPTRASAPESRGRPAAPWGTRLVAGFAALCLVVAVTSGVFGISAEQRLQATQAQNRAISAVLSAPDARIASQPVTHGGTATVVVSRSERKVVVTTRGLPALPSSRVYQLWFIGPSRVASAGLLPGPSEGRTAPVLASGLQPQDRLGMTVEPAGGTSRPTTTPILVMSLPA